MYKLYVKYNVILYFLNLFSTFISFSLFSFSNVLSLYGTLHVIVFRKNLESKNLVNFIYFIVYTFKNQLIYHFTKGHKGHTFSFWP